MANLGFQHRVDEYLRPEMALVTTSITAGGAGDGVEVDGEEIDRKITPDIPLSMMVVLGFDTTLAQDETLSATVQVQDAEVSGGPWADFGDVVDFGVMATGPSGGGQVIDAAKQGVDISGARQFVRLQVTPDLSAGATDTADVTGMCVMGGFDKIPPSA